MGKLIRLFSRKKDGARITRAEPLQPDTIVPTPMSPGERAEAFIEKCKWRLKHSKNTEGKLELSAAIGTLQFLKEKGKKIPESMEELKKTEIFDAYLAVVETHQVLRDQQSKNIDFVRNMQRTIESMDIRTEFYRVCMDDLMRLSSMMNSSIRRAIIYFKNLFHPIK